MVLNREQVRENFKQTEVEHRIDELDGTVLLRKPSAEVGVVFFKAIEPWTVGEGDDQTFDIANVNTDEGLYDVCDAMRKIVADVAVDMDGNRIFNRLNDPVLARLDGKTLFAIIDAIPKTDVKKK